VELFRKTGEKVSQKNLLERDDRAAGKKKKGDNRGGSGARRKPSAGTRYSIWGAGEGARWGAKSIAIEPLLQKSWPSTGGILVLGGVGGGGRKVTLSTQYSYRARKKGRSLKEKQNRMHTASEWVRETGPKTILGKNKRLLFDRVRALRETGESACENRGGQGRLPSEK